MKQLDSEQILWESKNKKLVLTTHRLREERKSFLGSSIRSIMLDKLMSSELRTTMDYGLLRRAFTYFLGINLIVYLLNNYLFNSELMILFFGDVHIGANSVQLIFNLSIIVAIAFLVLFFLSVKKVFSFHTTGLTIDFQLRWLSFEERENFISKVEEAQSNRHQ